MVLEMETLNWQENKLQRKIAVEYVNLCGRKLGDNQWVCDYRILNLDEIASQLGSTKKNNQTKKI